jgi:DNA-binding Xre family transcriptional regulator
MENQKEIYANLKVGTILRERCIKVEDFATMARLSYRTALNISKNRNDRIDLETIGKICHALDVTPNDIISVVH